MVSILDDEFDETVVVVVVPDTLVSVNRYSFVDDEVDIVDEDDLSELFSECRWVIRLLLIRLLLIRLLLIKLLLIRWLLIRPPFVSPLCSGFAVSRLPFMVNPFASGSLLFILMMVVDLDVGNRFFFDGKGGGISSKFVLSM